MNKSRALPMSPACIRMTDREKHQTDEDATAIMGRRLVLVFVRVEQLLTLLDDDAVRSIIDGAADRDIAGVEMVPYGAALTWRSLRVRGANEQCTMSSFLTRVSIGIPSLGTRRRSWFNI